MYNPPTRRAQEARALRVNRALAREALRRQAAAAAIARVHAASREA